MTVEMYRRRPTTVQTMLWDGTPERAEQIRTWLGPRADGGRHFVTPDDEATCSPIEAQVWNSQERAWFPVPVGHRVVRGVLGEAYSISPDAIAETYEPVGGDA